MTSEEILATEISTGRLNGEKFYDFLRGSLISKMRPFDGISPHSVLILDNCSVHHIKEATELLATAGNVVLYLPPCI